MKYVKKRDCYGWLAQEMCNKCSSLCAFTTNVATLHLVEDTRIKEEVKVVVRVKSLLPVKEKRVESPTGISATLENPSMIGYTMKTCCVLEIWVARLQISLSYGKNQITVHDYVSSDMQSSISTANSTTEMSTGYFFFFFLTVVRESTALVVEKN